jgi:hypothetical protein
MNLIHRASDFTDAMYAAHNAARALVPDGVGLVGYGVAHLLDGDGRTKQLVPFSNLITDAGDLYYAGKAIVGISPANATAPTAANGMKLGTVSTAATKAGATSFIGTYITASNLVFDSTYPQTANLGTTLGVNAVYKTTWAAGTATSSTINEVTIVNDQATNTGGAAASTYSRAVLTTVNKTATDSLAVTWNHKFLGA